MNGYELKKILSEIVENTFPDSPRMKFYKGFYVELTDVKRKSYAGIYKGDDRVIRIVNLDTDDVQLAVTAIHELAHHIDTCDRGTTDHQDEFYGIYRKLLYTAIDMGLFTVAEYMKAPKKSGDDSKVRKMLNEYVPNKSIVKKPRCIIKVKGDTFSYKEQLKEAGFKWDAISRMWYSECRDDEFASKKELLDSLGLAFDVANGTRMVFDVKRVKPEMTGKRQERKTVPSSIRIRTK